jgi:hypothetical protein
VRIALLGGAVVFLAWVIWKDDGMPVLRNLMFAGGIGPLTLRDTLRLHSNEPVSAPVVAGLWLLATSIGVAGAFLLFDRLLRGAITAWSVGGRVAWLYLMVFIAGSAYWLAILLLDYWDSQFFDRYLVYLVPFAMVAVMAIPGMRLAADKRALRVTMAVGCMLLYAAFAVAGTHDYIAWNRARWLALDDLTMVRGVAPNRIDGGYEFNGWTHRQGDNSGSPRGYWWGDAGEPYVVAFGPIASYQEIGRYPVARWLPSTHAAILVLRKIDAPP